MSFYKKHKNNETLIISDDAIDIIKNAFDSVKEVYQEDIEREPSLAEIEEILQVVLELYGNDLLIGLENKEISECKFKIRKKRNKIVYQPGTVFSIYLSNIDKYAYGLLVKGQNINKPYDQETYFDFFSVFTEKELTMNEFKKYYSNEKDVLFTAYCVLPRAGDGDWKKLGELTRDLFDPSIYKLPNFITITNNGVYLLSRGRADIPLIEREVISEEEAKEIKNPSGILGSGYLEELLIKKHKES